MPSLDYFWLFWLCLQHMVTPQEGNVIRSKSNAYPWTSRHSPRCVLKQTHLLQVLDWCGSEIHPCSLRDPVIHLGNRSLLHKHFVPKVVLFFCSSQQSNCTIFQINIWWWRIISSDSNQACLPMAGHHYLTLLKLKMSNSLCQSPEREHTNTGMKSFPRLLDFPFKKNFKKCLCAVEITVTYI